jgi:ferredoxin
MPHVICEPCYECKSADCVEVCPVPGGCFHEGEKMLYINPAKCIDCEACVSECPVNAIYLDENVPEKWRNYIELNAQMAPKSPSITEKK